MEMIEVNFQKPRRRPRHPIFGEGVERASKVVLPNYPKEVEFTTEDRVFTTTEIKVKRQPFRFEGSNEIPKAPDLSDPLKRFIYESLGVAVREQQGRVEGPKGEDDSV